MARAKIDNSPQKVRYTESRFPIRGISRENSEHPSQPLNHLNRTVTPRRPRNADLRERAYLTPREVDRLEADARTHSRHAPRGEHHPLMASRKGKRDST